MAKDIYCPHCGSNDENVVKNGFCRTQGKKVQRYKCKTCNGTFVRQIFRNRDCRVKLLAVLLKQSEYSTYELKKFFGFSSSAITQWQKTYLTKNALDNLPMFHRQHIKENTKAVKLENVAKYLNGSFDNQHKGIFIELDKKNRIYDIKIFKNSN